MHLNDTIILKIKNNFKNLCKNILDLTTVNIQGHSCHYEKCLHNLKGLLLIYLK